MLRTYQIVDQQLRECPDGSGPIQMYVTPDTAERTRLLDSLQIDAHTLDSALDPEEPARIEFEPDHTALIVKRPRTSVAKDDLMFRITSVGLFLFADRLIIVLAEDSLQFAGKLFRRIGSLRDLTLRILFRSVEHFEQHLQVMNQIAGQIEAKLNRAMENRHLLNLFALEKSLVYYLNAIASNGRLLDRIRASAARMGLGSEELELLDDLAIENHQCHEVANTYSQVLAGLMDARASIVSNNLNILMKELTVVMLAIMFPSLIVALFSMNVRMPFDQEGSLIPFWIVVAGAAASSAAILMLYKHRK